MLGTIIKLAIVVVVVMIAINMLAPKQADKILSTVSEKTDINKDVLKDKLNKATDFTKDTLKEATDTVKDNLEK